MRALPVSMRKLYHKSSMFAPVNLRTEYLDNPLGIDVRTPHFCWQLSSNRRGQYQSAYQLLVASSRELLANGVGDKWDSGRVLTPDTLHIAYAGAPLRSGERCYWAVRCWDRVELLSPWSEPALFEMGLLEEGDWQGYWIGAAEDVSAPLLRKAFTVASPIVEARAYICGLGYYELSLNGKRVGDHQLDPNWTNYDAREFRKLLYPFDDQSVKRALYVSYDVTNQLRQGENCLGVMLGNGWHNQRERTIEGEMWYGPPRLLLQMNIRCADGSCISVVSGDDWRYAPGPITFNNLFYGEVYDARLEQPGWNTPGFDDAGWQRALSAKKPAGPLRAQMSPPDKIMGRLAPVALTQPRPGLFVYDLGQNFAGWAQLRVSGPAGTQVRMRFAEELFPDGTLSFYSSAGEENDGAQIQRDIYILRGSGVEVYTPRFTWHCFRYVEVTGYPGEPGLDAITGLIVHSAVASAGDFTCSKSTLNAIQQLYRRTQLANYHGCVPSDCPHRERLGYTGDGQLTVESALYNFHAIPLYRKWLQDISDAQNHRTGFVPHTAPFYGGGGGPAWGSAYPIVAWLLYTFTGDRRILTEHFDGIKAWVDYLASCTDDDDIVIHEEPGSWCLGDWSLPGGFELADKLELPAPLVNTAYYGYCLRLLAAMAGALEKAEDETHYRQRLETIQAAFHRRFFDTERGCYSIGRKGADAFALLLDAVPETELPRLAENLRQTVRENGGHLDTGIFGTPLLLAALDAFGLTDLACEMLMQRTYPSYGYMLERGATTLWENWAEAQGSHCHPMYGSVSAWFFHVLAGIDRIAITPGGSRFLIRPRISAALSFAFATVETVCGTVTVQWKKRAGNALMLDVTIPYGTQATIVLSPKPAKPTISERGRVIWQDGAFTPVAGVTGVERSGSDITITIGGGAYEFIVRP